MTYWDPFYILCEWN